MFPLPCGAGSTVPREGFDSCVIMLFCGGLWLLHFLYNVGPHPVSSLHIYSFVVSRAFMVGAASQAGDADSSQAPGLTSDLQGSLNVHQVLYCWCHSGSASVLLYFTLVCWWLFYAANVPLQFSTLLGLLYDMANPMVVCLMNI